MNERLLVLAANEIVGGSERTIAEARDAVNAWREFLWELLKKGGTFSQIERWKASTSDCDAWLAAADRLEERNRSIERFREKVRNSPVLVLSDEERAHLDKIEAESKEQGTVSGSEVLLSILERARAEHDRVKALVEKWRTQAEQGERIEAPWSSAVLGCANELASTLIEPTDEPISDPAERAKAVAKELRRRVIWACVADMETGVAYVLTMRRVDGLWTRCVERHDMSDRAGAGPLAIADRIQAEEAKRAKAWAGDV